MNGFAPLIEGFLAFALTMLALTTGVSAIVGAINHVRRKHARGLRDMVRLFYLRELVPLLDRNGATRIDRSGSSSSQSIDVGGRSVLVDMNAAVPHATEAVDGQSQPPAPPALPLLGKDARRAEFIYDMTFMPLPVVVERLEAHGPAYWREKLESAEKLADDRWYTRILHPARIGRYWRTLRYSLQSLPDAEFRERLASSDVGLQLRTERAWEQRGLADWDALVEQLLKKFQVIGAASSETFARHARGWCVVVGFVLAAMLNIDSLDLLNSYLTDPGVRQRVLDRSDAILAQETPSAATDAAGVAAAARTRFDTTAAQLTTAARDLSGTLETIRTTTAGTDAEALVQKVASQLDQVSAQMQTVQDGVKDLEDDMTMAEQRIRGVTRSLTASFPIGWKRFPNCAGSDAPDVRCQGRTFMRQASTAQAPVMGLAAVAAAPTRWTSVLVAAQAADPDAFNQWVIGIVLTGLLLGLGTPFWVQAVSTAFNLRRWDARNTAAAASAAEGTANVSSRSHQASGASDSRSRNDTTIASS